MPIAVPLSWKKNMESKVQELFFKIKSAALLLNRGFISSLKVVRKYSEALRLLFGMLEYKFVTSNVTIFVSGSTFLGHFFEKSALSRI